MGNKILILDDDVEYNTLLNNVFTQADYEVEAVEDAESALEKLEDNHYDLILTDQRLPRLSGLEFIRKVREQDRQTPIIMVSGFLDNDTIRDLIREGVEGLFIKPLNIFSLLKKTGEVIEMYRLRGEDRAQEEQASGAGSEGRPLNLRSIPGYSAKGRDFLHKLEEHRNFTRNLLLIGPPGMPYEGIATEVSRTDGEQEGLGFFCPGDVGEESIMRELERAVDKNFSRVTVVVLQADQLSPEEQQRVMNLAEGNEPFTNLVVPVRFIFCLGKTVEELYDSEEIDEDFYLFLGSNELHVPGLKDMPEDIIAIAERELHGLSTDWQLDAKAKTLLCRQSWDENVLELRTVVNRAASLSHPLAPSGEHFERAIQSGADTDGQPENRKDRFRDFLSRERSSYVEAFRRLKNSNP